MDRTRGTQRVTLGRIVGLFGVKGWVKIYSATRPIEDILNYSEWLVGGEGAERRVRLLDGRLQGPGLVALLEGCADRDQARALVGATIAVERAQLPALAEGEYYWCDLEGLRVLTLEGQVLGNVDHLIETGANDVLVVHGERERLLPYTGEVVRRIDLEAGLIEVDWDADF